MLVDDSEAKSIQMDRTHTIDILDRIYDRRSPFAGMGRSNEGKGQTEPNERRADVCILVDMLDTLT